MDKENEDLFRYIILKAYGIIADEVEGVIDQLYAISLGYGMDYRQSLGEE